MSELKFVKLSNNETLAYREAGDKEKTLLLIHGNMSSSKHWDTVIEKLQNKYKIYAVDMRGFGESTYNEPINSLRDLADDINEFTQKLNISSYIACGWSTGGGVALELAANYSDKVEKVILVESVGVKGYPIFRKDENNQVTSELIKTKEDISKDPVQVLPVLVALENKDKEFYKVLWNATIYNRVQPDSKKYDIYIDEMLKQRNLVDIDYALAHFNMTNEYNGVESGFNNAKDVKCEVLVFQGDSDYIVPMYMAKDIENYIENTKLVILKNSGHSPMTDCLEILCDEIEIFIENIS